MGSENARFRLAHIAAGHYLKENSDMYVCICMCVCMYKI